MQGCVFCKIIAGELPSRKLYEDDRVLAFHDINPAAPTHFLVVPKRHIKSAADLGPETESLAGHLFTVIANLTKELGISDFRIVSNNGEGAGQTVFHLHFHVLAGVKMNNQCPL
jgi:histidine triad (HIT) family protein